MNNEECASSKADDKSTSSKSVSRSVPSSENSAENESDAEEVESDEGEIGTGMKGAYSVDDLMDALNDEDVVDGSLTKSHLNEDLTKINCAQEKGVKNDDLTSNALNPILPECSNNSLPLSATNLSGSSENSVSKAAESKNSTNTASESDNDIISRESNVENVDALCRKNIESNPDDDADAASMYESVAEIRERKRRSCSQEKDASPVKVVSDISGRFVIDDAVRPDKKDLTEVDSSQDTCSYVEEPIVGNDSSTKNSSAATNDLVLKDNEQVSSAGLANGTNKVENITGMTMLYKYKFYFICLSYVAVCDN